MMAIIQKITNDQLGEDMKTVILSVLIALPAFAASSFTGKWEGAGRLDTNTSSQHCKKVQIELELTEAVLKLVSAYWSCGEVGATEGLQIFSIKGNKVFLGETTTEVGWVSDHQIHFDYTNEEGTHTVIHFTRVGNHFNYDRTLTLKGTEEFWHYNARMAKVD